MSCVMVARAFGLSIPSVSADDEANFKLGEIDLSAYDADGIPNMAAGLIHNGLLYVAMQAQSPSFDELGTATVAVIDTTTDTEVDTDGDASNGTTGITLTIRNPLDIDMVADRIYVTGIGRFFPQELTGGVERIDPVDYSTDVIIDDEEMGQTQEIALISDSIGYLVDFAGFRDTSLYEFNPTTGVIEDEPLEGFSGVDLQTLALAPDGNLWVGVGDAESPEIRIIDPNTNTLIDSLSTLKNPAAIVFTE